MNKQLDPIVAELKRCYDASGKEGKTKAGAIEASGVTGTQLRTYFAGAAQMPCEVKRNLAAWFGLRYCESLETN